MLLIHGAVVALAFTSSRPTPAVGVRYQRVTPAVGARHQRVFAVAEEAALCLELQNGREPEGLRTALTKRASANRFMKEYLSGAEWTCADATPPSALTASLREAPDEVLEVLLLSLVQGAAASSERRVERALSLINALWMSEHVLRQSSAALRDAVDVQLGAEQKMAEDASQGNLETIRSMWTNLLSVCNLSTDDFARAKVALARCGAGETE
jgi:hypothetical protein